MSQSTFSRRPRTERPHALSCGECLTDARGGGFALIDLLDVDVVSASSQFTETEGVPSDAATIGKTWAKANKDGSRDRRFANDNELPIAHYGQLRVAGPGGLNEVFMASRPGPCAAFAGAVQDMKRLLASSRAIRKVTGRKAIPKTG